MGLFSVQVCMAESFTITPVLQYFHYSEFKDDNQLLDKETGILPGLNILFDFDIVEDLQLFTALKFLDGKVDYQGYSQSGMPIQTATEERISKIEFGVSRSFKLYGYDIESGLSFQRVSWNRKILMTRGVAGLFEQYVWDEVDIFVKHRLHEKADVAIDIIYHYFTIVNPMMRVNLSEFDFSTPNIALGEKNGFRLVMVWSKSSRISNLDYSIGAYYEQFEFGKSDDVEIQSASGRAIIREPRSESKHIGVYFGVSKPFL